MTIVKERKLFTKCKATLHGSGFPLQVRRIKSGRKNPHRLVQILPQISGGVKSAPIGAEFILQTRCGKLAVDSCERTLWSRATSPTESIPLCCIICPISPQNEHLYFYKGQQRYNLSSFLELSLKALIFLLNYQCDVFYLMFYIGGGFPAS